MARPDVFESLDALTGMQGDQAQNEVESTPLPYETPAMTQGRVAQGQTQRIQYGRMKAQDLASRGIPYDTSGRGNVSEITDDSGAPLTNADKSRSIAYDSSGKPVDYSQKDPTTGKRVLRDPYEFAPTQTDKVGNIYKAPAGLPWQQTGEVDPVVQQQAQQKINAQTATALAPVEQQAKAQLTHAAKQVKQSAEQLKQAAIPSFPGVDTTQTPENIRQQVEDKFATDMKSPDATATSIWTNGMLTPEAEAKRKELLAQKTSLLSAVDAHQQVFDQARQAQAALDQVRTQRQTFAGDKFAELNRRRVAAGLDPVAIPGSSVPAANVAQEPVAAPADEASADTAPAATPAAAPAPASIPAAAPVAAAPPVAAPAQTPAEKANSDFANNPPPDQPVPVAAATPAGGNAKQATLWDRTKNFLGTLVGGAATGTADILKSPMGQAIQSALGGPGELVAKGLNQATKGTGAPELPIPSEALAKVVGHLSGHPDVDNIPKFAGQQLDKVPGVITDPAFKDNGEAKVGRFVGGVLPWVAQSAILPEATIPTLFSVGYQGQHDAAIEHLGNAGPAMAAWFDQRKPTDEEKADQKVLDDNREAIAQKAGVIGGAVNTILGIPFKNAGGVIANFFGKAAPEVVESAFNNAYSQGGGAGVVNLMRQWYQHVQESGGLSDAAKDSILRGLNGVMNEIKTTVGQRILNVAGHTALGAGAGAINRFGQNAVAQGLYDPNQSLSEGVAGEAAGFGAMSALFGAVDQTRAARRASEAQETFDSILKGNKPGEEPPAGPAGLGAPTEPGPTSPNEPPPTPAPEPPTAAPNVETPQPPVPGPVENAPHEPDAGNQLAVLQSELAQMDPRDPHRPLVQLQIQQLSQGNQGAVEPAPASQPIVLPPPESAPPTPADQIAETPNTPPAVTEAPAPEGTQSPVATEGAAGPAGKTGALAPAPEPQGNQGPTEAKSGETTGKSPSVQTTAEPEPAQEPTPKATQKKPSASPSKSAEPIPLAEKTGEIQKPTDVLHEAKNVKLTTPKGATFIQATNAKGQKSIELVSAVTKGLNPFYKAGPWKTIQAGVKNSRGEFTALRGDLTASDANKPAVSFEAGSGASQSHPKSPSPPVSQHVEKPPSTNGLTSGDHSSDEAIKQSPEAQRVTKLANAALALHKANGTLDALGHPHAFEVGETRGGSGIETDVKSQKILLDPEKLAKVTSNMTPAKRAEFVKRAVAEEVIHVGTLKYAAESDANRSKLLGLTKDELLMEKAGKAYGPEWDKLPEFNKAAEAARMLLQGPEKLTEDSYRFLKDFLEWMKTKLKNLSKDAREVLDGIRAKLGQYENSAQETKEQAPPKEGFSSVNEVSKFVEKKRGELQSRIQDLYGVDEVSAKKIMRGFYNEDSSDHAYEVAQRITDKLGLSEEQNARIEADPITSSKGDGFLPSSRFPIEDIENETDPRMLASHIVNGIRLGADKPSLSESHLSTIAALLRAKEVGVTWSDLARYIDEFTTRNSGSMSDKTPLFKDIAEKVKNVVDEYGIKFAQGDLAATDETPATPEEIRAEIAKLKASGEDVPKWLEKLGGKEEPLSAATPSAMKRIKAATVPFDVNSKYMGGTKRNEALMVPGVWLTRSGDVIPIDDQHGVAAARLLGLNDASEGKGLQAGYGQGWVRATIRNWGDDKSVALSGPKMTPAQKRNVKDWAATQGYGVEDYTGRYIGGELAAATPGDSTTPEGEAAPSGQQPSGSPQDRLSTEGTSPTEELTPAQRNEKLMSEAEAAGLQPSLETIKGILRNDPVAMDKLRAMIKDRTGKDAINAANPVTKTVADARQNYLAVAKKNFATQPERAAAVTEARRALTEAEDHQKDTQTVRDILSAYDGATNGKFGDNKIFINRLHEAMGSPGTLAAFKDRLNDLRQKGLVSLSANDLNVPEHRADREASEIDNGKLSPYHFVNAEETRRLNGEPGESLGGKEAINAATPDEYQGQHTPPDHESGAPLHDLTANGVYPDDVYSNEGRRYYGTGYDELDRQAHALMQNLKGKPNAKVTIYRAAPDSQSSAKKQLKEVNSLLAYRDRFPFFPVGDKTIQSLREKYKDQGTYNEQEQKIIGDLKKQQAELEKQVASKSTDINPGDWVTPIRKYAVEHGQGALNGEYQIIKKTVPAKDVFTNGDSWLEAGYDPEESRAPKSEEGESLGAANPDEERHHANFQPRDETGAFAEEGSIGAARPRDTGVASRVKGAIKSLGEHLRGVSQSPAIRDLDFFNAVDEGTAHVGARSYVPLMVKDFMHEIFGPYVKDAAFVNRVGETIRNDNILGGYDGLKKDAAKLAQKADRSPAETRELGSLRNRISEIEKAHDLDALDTQVREAEKDGAIRGAINQYSKVVAPEMDALYNEMKGVDPSTPRDTRGRHLEARVNLLSKDAEARMADYLDPDKPMPEMGASSYRNPDVKRDKFDKRASYTGDYSSSIQNMLTNSFAGRVNEVTKQRLYSALEKSGKARILDQGENAPEEIAGEPASTLSIKRPETTNGKTQQVAQRMVVPASKVETLRRVLNTDLAPKQNPIFKALTKLQIIGVADATAHTKNQLSVVTNTLGRDANWKAVVSRIPILGTLQSISEIRGIAKDVAAGGPAITKELAELAKNGMLRSSGPEVTGWRRYLPGSLLHQNDVAARVFLSRAYDRLVKDPAFRAFDTLKDKRAFIMQIGEYNRRLMSALESTLRDYGASPFIVAGKTFNRFGKRLVFGEPGFKSRDYQSAVRARAAMLTPLLFGLAATVLGNLFLSGTLFGRKGTPIGAIDSGPEHDDKKGNRKYIDLLQISGIRRGLRAIGLDAMLNGLQKGDSVNEIAGKMISDAFSTNLHPYVGPGLGAIFETVTGKRLDLRQGWAQSFEARKYDGGKQYIENARAALKHLNVFGYALAKPAISAAMSAAGMSLPAESKTYGGGIADAALKSPLSAFGYKEGQSPALELAHKLNSDRLPLAPADEQQQVKRIEKSGLVDQIRVGQMSGISQAVRDGTIKANDIPRIIQQANQPAIVSAIHTMPLDLAERVYAKASPEEKGQLLPVIMQKRENAAKRTVQFSTEKRTPYNFK